DSHGMKVLSTIASNLPGQFVGTAPKADFFLIRTEDAASENIIEEFNWVAGAELADSIGADIVHSSLGYSNFDDTTLSHTYADMNGDIAPSTIGADIAASKGMLVVVSAGNEGNDAWQYITAPGDADSVLTVGATDRYGDYAFFSSVGPTVDGRVKPNVTAQGLSATVIAINGDISTSSGTSFSGPIIAGMAASLWQARPELNNMALIKAMENNASQSVAPDSLLGYGLPDFYMAWMYPTAIETVDIENQIQIYPNPFNESFEINISTRSERKNVSIQVYDLNGSKIIEKKLTVMNKTTVDFSGLNAIPAGMYFVKLKVGENIYKLKMLKQ
ncbi:MAG: S8 family peptidase, partial [Bacteroidales bacterium]|nr:S8 family peptidase [Bacteroidales bacterium]